MKVNGSNAVFISDDNGERFVETAKIENVTKKFDNTAVETTTKGATQYITAIELGGSKTKLDFK